MACSRLDLSMFRSALQCTLVFILKDKQVLLGMKKRGFGAGRWNGFGGKPEPNETLDQCAKRELFEECGLIVPSLQRIGILNFEMLNKSLKFLVVHVYVGSSFTGNLGETNEMLPKWFDIGNIPFDEMWPDDRFWFPYLLSQKNFIGVFKLEGHDKVLEQNIWLPESLPPTLSMPENLMK